MVDRPSHINWRALVLPILVILGLEIGGHVLPLETEFWPVPSQIATAGWAALLNGSLLNATLETLTAATLGLLLGGSVGLAGGITLGLFPVANKLLTFSIEAVRPIPPTAIIPVALLVLGAGMTMEVSIVAFSAAWPILIFTRSAIQSVEPRLIEVSKVLCLGFFSRVWKIVLPAALPRIFVALRLAVAIALVVCVTVEVTANPIGLGYGMRVAQQALRPDLMFAYLVWIGVVGWSLNLLLTSLQKLLVWRQADEGR
ncbi:ABC transporter permease subunit [Pelagibacterium lacus]|uniref:ABC transporter permease subunit n=1 Tax=Pelagibacterium lacus TaxID=2282655 RepID=A0A369W0N6_9HYPH|nr:ABC transporter permease subunit [Pelagibacterium lacus]